MAYRKTIIDTLIPRQDDMEERRHRLGLSRVALARILDVDPSTVYRYERDGKMPVLLDLAMRAIEASFVTMTR
jgi:predicted transcriptional regulator